MTSISHLYTSLYGCNNDMSTLGLLQSVSFSALSTVDTLGDWESSVSLLLRCSFGELSSSPDFMRMSRVCWRHCSAKVQALKRVNLFFSCVRLFTYVPIPNPVDKPPRHYLRALFWCATEWKFPCGCRNHRPSRNRDDTEEKKSK